MIRMAPLKFLNVKPGERVEVKVAHKMETEFVPPPMKAFTGAGHRLGAVIPGETMPGAFNSGPSTVPSASVPPPPASFSLDPSLPTTAVQIRLSDGTRLIVKCNHSHTLGDIRGFIQASRPSSGSFILQTMHPVKEMNEWNKSVKDLGLLNAVIVQKRV